jgi:hypothetical protein
MSEESLQETVDRLVESTYVKQKPVSFDSLESRIADLEALATPLVQFVDKALRVSFDGCDYDGGSIQDDLHRLGLLEEKTMTEPCGDVCDCAELVGEFPTQCYRITPQLMRAINRSREKSREADQ